MVFRAGLRDPCMPREGCCETFGKSNNNPSEWITLSCLENHLERPRTQAIFSYTR
jgi:hypothetical protein